MASRCRLPSSQRAERSAAIASGPITEFPTVSQKELGSPNVFSFFSKAMSSTEKEESKTFTQEPPRTSLIEPPPGYQTPSPQPMRMALGKKDERPTAKNYYADARRITSR